MTGLPFFKSMRSRGPRSVSNATLPDTNATVPISPESGSVPSIHPMPDEEAFIATAPMKRNALPAKRFKRARILSFACVAIIAIFLISVVACSSVQNPPPSTPTGLVTPTPPTALTPPVSVTPTPPIPQVVINLSTAQEYSPQSGPVNPTTQFSHGSKIYAVFQESLDLLPPGARGCLKGVLQADHVFSQAGPDAIPPNLQAVTGGWAYLLFQPSPPASSVVATITVFWSPVSSCTDPLAVWNAQAQISVTIG
jgi:hypothetical protein